MPSYTYKALKKDGSVLQGSIEAATEGHVGRELRGQGLMVIDVSVAREGESGRQRTGPGFNKKQVLSFTSELAVLLRAGLPLDRALKVLIDMSESGSAKSLLEGLLTTVKGGKGLSFALAEKPDVFDDFYISMIRSGEASGNLAAVLNRLAEQLENAKQVRSNVVSALIYPAILAVVALVSVLVMLGFVVPQFDALFADMGEALPAVTQLVISGGEAIKNNGLYILIVAALIVWFVRRWLTTVAGKEWLDTRMLKLPVLGTVVFKYEVARFARTIGTLIESGVPLIQSLNISTGTVGNNIVRRALQGITPDVKKGGRVSQSMADAELFSPMVIQMVRVGEESGQLDQMMLELARVYDDEVSAGVKRSLTLLEPVLILAMGGMIGFIIVAILLGILSVNDLAG
ncbi:type II secretion system F family protein [Gilvimarinus agarilyticus]|uniref:type II secretion system F family protein n=1 Tax=Gilvimarinus sp. 2_MG-2023 TaxID=3062666 RepID=UPI001C09E169|nr:type II secretion system F family protein [Gilvimarinus sp. 2_MG-2023]MBU2887582.1 type II secretion system F family protein [Gilvimarinus agarilyticus]MDO6572233.1 type II secretion system F family protein [Gilvimarinus sp. 2_MG-2023]